MYTVYGTRYVHTGIYIGIYSYVHVRWDGLGQHGRRRSVQAIKHAAHLIPHCRHDMGLYPSTHFCSLLEVNDGLLAGCHTHGAVQPARARLY